MEIIYPFLIVIILFLIVIIFVSTLRNRKTKKILLNFRKQDLQEVEINFSQTTYNSFNQFGGISKKAKLYFHRIEKVLIITTNNNSILSVLNNNLPLILVHKHLNSSKIITDYKVVNKVNFKSDEYILTIKDGFIKNKRIEITINSESMNADLKNIINEFKD
ncbi:hypothetical protein [Flavobacterium sp.]|uniref:hypothetical protein n=1 Tax=Flavobacterium sp. TaxID=239 RepID=UPI0022BCC7C0|nr:hypothetical protein [Flavobacterium sp.]MCZ8090918.1 hypothetical protein [Flavobacterium sp.]